LRVAGRVNYPQSGHDILARRDCANAVLDAPEIANSPGGEILTVLGDFGQNIIHKFHSAADMA